MRNIEIASATKIDSSHDSCLFKFLLFMAEQFEIVCLTIMKPEYLITHSWQPRTSSPSPVPTCLHESPRAQRPYQCDLTSAPAEVNESGRVVRRRAIAVLPR